MYMPQMLVVTPVPDVAAGWSNIVTVERVVLSKDPAWNLIMALRQNQGWFLLDPRALWLSQGNRS